MNISGAAVKEGRQSSANVALNGMTLDLNTPHRRMMATMLAGIAEFEWELTQERISSGINAAKAGGKHLGRLPGQRPKSDRLAQPVLALVAKGARSGSARQRDAPQRHVWSAAAAPRFDVINGTFVVVDAAGAYRDSSRQHRVLGAGSMAAVSLMRRSPLRRWLAAAVSISDGSMKRRRQNLRLTIDLDGFGLIGTVPAAEKWRRGRWPSR